MIECIECYLVEIKKKKGVSKYAKFLKSLYSL